MKTNSAKTHFIAFYSYKGGVGRTLALANCARALAASGKRVVVMDFDIEAPGLEHFEALRPKGEKKPKGDYPPLSGFAEYIHECRSGKPPAKLEPYIHLCKGLKSDKGEVWLMPAGRRSDPPYQEILALDWERFYREEDGYRLMENLRGHIEDEIEPDYVLMDSRTGLTEVGGIATHQLADMVVLLFNLNRQNLDGTKRVHDSLVKLKNPPILLLAASPIPAMPTGKGTPYHEKMSIVGKTLKRAKNAEKPIVIPYQPILAWEERILVDQKDDPFDFDRAYRQLNQLILDTLNDPNTFLDQAMHQWRDNDIEGAVKTLEQGLEENPDNLDLLRHLAEFQQRRGNYAEARKRYEQLRDSLRSKLGDENSATLTATNNLGETLRAQGDLTVARKLQEQTLEISRRILGAEHPHTLTAMNNLALTLQAQGDYAGARKLQEQVLEISRKFFGAEHPDTLRSMNNLAATLKAQGDLTGARKLQEQVLEIIRKIRGAEHPNTLISMNNLAATLHEQGDHTGARKLQEQTLEIQRRVRGAEHPDTLKSMDNLALTLHAQGDLTGASKLQEQTLEISRRILGNEHPDTLVSMNNLAETLRALGNYTEARKLQEQTLEIQHRVLGAEHPNTSISAFNLFATLQNMQQPEAAAVVFQEHLAWLLQRDPDSLGADQRDLQQKLNPYFRQTMANAAD